MEYSDQIKNRLRRIEGQIRGVLSMMEQEKDCREVVTQLSAIRSAVDRAVGLVVATNMEACIRVELEKGNNPESVVKEAIDLLVKSR
ncbi:metal-sensitive transcriptional regulator [Aneurinibacillus terranovensis]|uniref:metal-sensitive transcriptional regulator n=1 Tax=Aneurinibacillus terranovensis TaxID=278991 RepID=UPI0003FDB77A|nr:metal-sensitive transcriptional regulator [Aneurinibacillus terranovensis]